MTERNEFIEVLDKKIQEITESTAIEEDEAGNRSTALFTTTKDGGGISLFETGFYDMWEDYPLLEIMITPQFEVKTKYMPEVEKLISNFNYTIPFGHMGVQYELERMYYRYVFSPDMEKSAEELADQTVEIYKRLAMIFGGVFELFERLATGVSTFEEELEKDGNLKQ